LEDELKKASSDSIVSIAALEAKVKSAEAHNAEVATASDKRLSDFEAELIRDLVGLQKLYIRNVQSIGGLSSPMPKGYPSGTGYNRWLSTEVAGLPEMFASVNKNSISIAVQGALIMASESVDLNTLQDITAVSGPDIFPIEQDVRRAAHAVSKKWWCSFSYNYVLGAIRMRL
jgi:hypothetical protein